MEFAAPVFADANLPLPLLSQGKLVPVKIGSRGKAFHLYIYTKLDALSSSKTP